MRTIKWSDLRSQQRAHLLELMQRQELRRLPRTRPRDPDEERALSLIVQTRWQRWLETGKLRIIGPRLWLLRLGKEPEGSLDV